MQSYLYNAYTMPRSLKNVITIIMAFSLVSALTHKIILPVVGGSLQMLLSLSNWGLSKGFFWQLATYLFVQPVGLEVNFSFFIGLFFNLFLIYFVGRSIIEIKSSKHFLFLFLGGGIFASITTSTMMYLFNIPFYVASCHATIYCLLAAWMFFYPHRELLLFLVFPVKVKWLILITAGTTLFIDLCNGSFVNFTLVFSSIIYGYFYALIIFEKLSPFTNLYRFERTILDIKHRMIGSKWDSLENYLHPKKRKVYDFKTGKVVIDDETFLNVCLEKINRFGKSSLSLYERFRLRRISKKMHKKNKTSS